MVRKARFSYEKTCIVYDFEFSSYRPSAIMKFILSVSQAL